MESNDLARRMVDLISDKKGEDIVLMDLRQVTPIADYFVIATGSNERLLNALIDHLREEVKKEAGGKIPIRTEGKGPNGWVLMDYGDVVVHLFSPQMRNYYDLESLWADANVLVRMQ